jgi:two-component system, NarL family, sensor histidine kinase LiaS
MTTREEHYRLVSDLHDSIQQEVFALALQIGALKILVSQKTDIAINRLEDIEYLVCLIQQDLALIADALRPMPREAAPQESAWPVMLRES